MIGMVPLWEEEEKPELTLSPCYVRHRKAAAICDTKREPSLDTEPAGTLIWEASLQNWEKINFCCFSHPLYLFDILLWQTKLTNAVYVGEMKGVFYSRVVQN